MFDFIKNHCDRIIVIFVFIAICAPVGVLLGFNLSETGQIGDTLGGTTAPFWGFLSVILLYLTLKDQQKFNENQQNTNEKQQIANEKQLLANERQQVTNEKQLLANEKQQVTNEKQLLVNERQQVLNESATLINLKVSIAQLSNEILVPIQTSQAGGSVSWNFLY